MKRIRITLCMLVLALFVFSATACSRDTIDIVDQRGQTVSMSFSASDTYTFKVPASEAPVLPETTTVVEETTETTTLPPETTTEAPAEVPPTGDESSPVLWIGLAGLSAIVCIGLVAAYPAVSRSRKKND